SNQPRTRLLQATARSPPGFMRHTAGAPCLSSSVRRLMHMHLSLKTLVAVGLMLFICTRAAATEITHDWTIGGWVKNGIGFAGFRQGDGTVDTEFRYGHGAFDYFN